MPCSSGESSNSVFISDFERITRVACELAKHLLPDVELSVEAQEWLEAHRRVDALRRAKRELIRAKLVDRKRSDTAAEIKDREHELYNYLRDIGVAVEHRRQALVYVRDIRRAGVRQGNKKASKKNPIL